MKDKVLDALIWFMCKIGLHSDYKYDGEWSDQCAFCDFNHPDTTQDKGMAEIITGKQRNGPIGTVRLSWQGPYTKFDNLAMGSVGYSSGGYEPF